MRELLLLLLVMLLAGLYTLAFTPGRAGHGSFNLLPLRILADTLEAVQAGNWSTLRISFLGNIALFVPLGLISSLIWADPGWRRAGGTGLAVSISIELGQLFCNRSTDIDDLILNTLGAIAGYWIIFPVLRRASTFVMLCRIQEDS